MKTGNALTVLSIAMGIAISGAAAAKDGDTLLTGATILDGAGGRITGDILVRDGRIAEMGAELTAPDAVQIDARGRWITPGLIDAHTHYGTFLLPLAGDDTSDIMERRAANVAGTFIENGVRPADPAFSYALRSGVTTAQILPGSNALFSGRAVVVNPVPAVVIGDMRVTGAARGLKMACGSNPAYRSLDDEERFPSSRQGQVAAVRAEFEAARQAMQTGADVDADRGSLIAALKGDAPVHLHCYRAEDISNWLDIFDDFGITRVTIHHASEAYKIAPRIAASGACVATWSNWWGFKREAEDAIPEIAAYIDAAGGCALMHSDIPLIGGLLNIEAAKAAAAGRRAGLDVPPERAIRWITSNPARALGLQDRTGTLAPGLDADIVLWSGDPFSIYSQPDRVMLRGVTIYNRRDGMPPPDFELGRPAREDVR